MKISKMQIAIYLMIAAGFILSMVFYDKLPDSMASHWNAKGQVDDYMSKSVCAFLLPGIMIFIVALFAVIVRIDPLKANIEKFRSYYEGFIFFQTAFLLVLHIWMLLWNTGIKVSANFIMPLTVGGLYFFLGMILGKIKRNWFLGIRTPWTLSNETVWRRTHEFSGTLFKVAGLIAMVGALFAQLAIWFVLVPILAASVIITVYSYVIYKRVKASGTDADAEGMEADAGSGDSTWDNIKEGYLQQVEKSLMKVSSPRKKEVLEDVACHLDQKFSELADDDRTWENYQKIITEMGPAGDYGELLSPASLEASTKKFPLAKILMAVVIAVLIWMLLPYVFKTIHEAGLPNFKQQAHLNGKQLIIKQAESQARLLNHEYIGTEHILLALVAENSVVISNIFKNFGINREQIYDETLRLVKKGKNIVYKKTLPMTDRTKLVLKKADELARDSGSDTFDSLHVLLGILQVEDGVGAQVLMNMGLNFKNAQEAITHRPGGKTDVGGEIVEPAVTVAKPQKPWWDISAKKSRAETTGSSQPEFKTTLPNGVTVELMGICKYDDQELFWKPDGSRFVSDLRVDIKNNIAGQGRYAFFFKLNTDDFNLKFNCDGSESNSGTDAKNSVGERMEGYWVVIPDIDKGIEKTNIRIGIATGQWQTIAEFDGNRKTSGPKDVVFANPIETKTGIAISVRGEFGWEGVRRIVAIDKNGKLHRGGWGGRSSGDHTISTGTFNRMSLDQIEKYQVRFRPYKFVKIGNVSLKPNSKSDPQGGKPSIPIEIDTTSLTDGKLETNLVGSAIQDIDKDGLSDFQEVHKYLTDPTKKDSDGDGIIDGDWDERREYTYSIRSVLRFMPPLDKKALNDDFQDGRVLQEKDDYIEIEVIHYPLSTTEKAIAANPDWQSDYAEMTEYIKPGITTNWDAKMRQELLAELKADGIAIEELTDKQVVEQVSNWLLKKSRYLDKVFTTYYIHCPDGKPSVYPGLEDSFEHEFNRDNASYNWTIDHHLDHEVLGKGMFYNKTHGSCTSTAIYLTTVLRAIGIPTRMIIVSPMVDASNVEQFDLVKNGVSHNQIREDLLASLRKSSRGFTNHTFNEVYVGNHWHRLDHKRLGPDRKRPFGLPIHLYTFNDLSEANLAATWGMRYGKGQKSDVFGHDNPYSAKSVSDLFGKHSNIQNPSAVKRTVSHSSRPNLFIICPPNVPAFQEITEMLKDIVWNKTGRHHEKQHYDGLFNGRHNRKHGDILVLLFSLDTPERIPSEYEDLLPMSWSKIEAELKQGKTVEIEGKRRDLNVILLAGQTRKQLTSIIRNSKLLNAVAAASHTAGTVRTKMPSKLSASTIVEGVGSVEVVNRQADPQGGKLLIPIEIDTTTRFLPGDSIEITEILGTTSRIEAGQSYLIKGKYKLSSRNEAQIHFLSTNGATGCPHGPTIKRGRGEFTRTLKYIEENKDAWLQAKFCPVGGNDSFGDLYFYNKNSHVPDIPIIRSETSKSAGQVNAEGASEGGYRPRHFVMIVAGIFVAIFIVARYSTRSKPVEKTIEASSDSVRATCEYKDSLIEIYDDTIVFKNYYLWGDRSVKLSQVEYVKAVPPTLRNGKWRFHGTGDLLFRIWFPADYERNIRDKIFVMKIKGKWTRIGFTVENSYTVSEIFKSRGLL